MATSRTSNVPARTSIDNCLSVHDRTSSVVHNQNTLLQLCYLFFVKHPSTKEERRFIAKFSTRRKSRKRDEPNSLCFLGKRSVDDDDVALGQHCVEILLERSSYLTLELRIHLEAIMVEEIAVERLQPLEQKPAYSPSSNRSNGLAFEVIGSMGDGSDVPFPTDDLMVSRQVVPDEDEDPHEFVFSNRDSVAPGDLGHCQPSLSRSLEINVVRTNASGQQKLQVLRLLDSLRGYICRVERSRNQHVQVGYVLVELCIFRNSDTRNKSHLSYYLT